MPNKTLSAIALLLAGCATSTSERPTAFYAILDPATGMTYNVPLRHSLLTAGVPAAVPTTSRSSAPQGLDPLFSSGERIGATQTAPTVVASAATVSMAPVELPQRTALADPVANAVTAKSAPLEPAVIAAAYREPVPALNLKRDTEFESAKRLIMFATGRASFGPIGKLAIAELIPWAKQAEKVYVRGGADSSGNEPRNRELAMARASAVTSAFTAAGVPPGKITSSFCPTCYVTSNDTEEGRRINRRVEVEMLLQKDLHAQLPKPVYAVEAPQPVPLIRATSFHPSPR